MTNEELEKEFHAGCIQGYHDAKKELGYTATYFLQMIQQHGAVPAAKLLLQNKEISDGLRTLWEYGRLDMSLENYLLNPKFVPLFTAEERNIARQKLKSLSFEPDWKYGTGD